jgi:BirA family transcriptional regulator, biotin operon repressor / biotin---[acetyl-CoA-carboxylase] ligase
MLLITTLDKTESTNAYLQNLVQKKKKAEDKLLSIDIPEFYTVCTNFQTNGRGQKENVWHSDPEKNILLSTIIYPCIDAEKQFYVNMAITLGILDFCNRTISHKGFSIKWPNDIYYNDKKLGGILIEHTIMSNKILYSIVGIGLNINQIHFPENIPNPISASQICGISFQVEQCIRHLLSDIISRYTHSLKNPEKLKKEYLDSLYRFNKLNQFIYNKSSVFAKITDVNLYGMLCLTTNEGKKIECGFKEISYII